MDTVYKPTIKIFPEESGVDRYVADKVIKQLSIKPDSTLTIATGSTPIGAYKLLADEYDKGNVSFKHARIFSLDEYWPIQKTNPASYAFYVQKYLIDTTDINPENCHIPDGEAPDAAEEARRYDDLLHTYPSDLAIVGIGPGTTYHIGFNEKGSEATSHTRYVTLDPQTIGVNSQYFPNPTDIPKGAITQGIADILMAKKILLLAKGEGKAQAITRTVNGPVGPDAPSSFLRLHPNVTVVVDAGAAGKL